MPESSSSKTTKKGNRTVGQGTHKKGRGDIHNSFTSKCCKKSIDTTNIRSGATRSSFMVKDRGNIEVQGNIYCGPFSGDGPVEESVKLDQINKGRGGTYNSYNTKNGNVEITQTANIRSGAFSGNRPDIPVKQGSIQKPRQKSDKQVQHSSSRKESDEQGEQCLR